MDKLRRTLAGDDEEQNEERGFASQVSSEYTCCISTQSNMFVWTLFINLVSLFVISINSSLMRHH